MHDLRRQALESGKTVSKKAQSRQSSRASSRANSAPNSRVTSRNASRHGSDEEEGGNLSDGTAWRYSPPLIRSLSAPPYEGPLPAVTVTVNSIDEVLAQEDSEQTVEQWTAELADRMGQIIDRKRSSVQGREESLASYVRILTAHYAKDEVRSKASELVTAFLKSIKAESSENETIFAMKALAMTLITIPSETIYDNVSQPLKRTISDSGSIATKAAAIHTLGTCTIYGGASDDEILENMTYFLEIISSDGNFVDAGDERDVVTAALEEWGFLATYIDDLEDESMEAMEAFVEQLESSDPTVQVAAGENIALAYEKSYTPQEDDEEVSDDGEAMSDPEDDSVAGAAKFVKRYTPYRRTDQLVHTLASLASLSTRRLSKKDKKSLHSNFADILNSVENPTRGPRYQNAVSHETGKRYGSRMVVRIHQNGVMRIDKWWKLHRLKALRRVLQGGFIGHYEKNEVVFESLPIMITNEK